LQNPGTLVLRKVRWFRFVWTVLIFLVLGALVNVGVAWGCFYGQVKSIMMAPYSGEQTKEWANPSDYPIHDQQLPAILRKSFPPCSQCEADAERGIGMRANSEFDVVLFDFGISTILSRNHWLGCSRESISTAHMHFNLDAMSNGLVRYCKTTILSTGFPMRSFWAYEVEDMRGLGVRNNSLGAGPNRYEKHGILGYFPGRGIPGLTGFRKWRQSLSMPYFIYPLGTILNSILYAGILWFLFGGFYLLRRRRRIGRGLCARCGYVVSVNVGVAGASLNCTECGMALPEQIKPRSYGGEEG